MIPVYIAVIAVLVLFSSYFSGTEIAYTSVNPGRISERYEKKKTPSLRFAVWFLSHFDDMLATILIGNNIVNQVASSMATVIVIELLGESFSWVATLVMTVIILVFGEVLPKSVCKACSESMCTATSLSLRALSIVFFPAIKLVNLMMDGLSRLWAPLVAEEKPISEGELSSVMDIVESEGVIDGDHTTLVKRAIDYKDIHAYEIITPRVDVEYIDINDTGEVIIRQALSSGHSRLPVCDGDADSILGVLHLNKLLFRLEAGDLSGSDDIAGCIREMMSPPLFVSRTTPLHDAVELMRGRQQQLLFVVDSYGGVMGILTMEDALEVIVGDIWDESDDIVPDMIKLSDTEYDLGAQLRLRELFDTVDPGIDTDEVESEFTVLGGWCTKMMGLSPDVGESFTYGPLTFTVKTLRDKMPDRVILTVSETEGNRTN